MQKHVNVVDIVESFPTFSPFFSARRFERAIRKRPNTVRCLAVQSALLGILNSGEFWQNSGKFWARSSQNWQKSKIFSIQKNKKLRLENGAFRFRIPKRCKGVHYVDLGESFPTSIYLQKLASIQPRTSGSKFADISYSLPATHWVINPALVAL